MTSQSTVPEGQTRNWFRSGTPWVWLTGAAIGVSLLAMLAVVVMLAWQGGRYLWPQPVWQFTLTEQVAGAPRALLGEMYARQTLTAPSTSTAAGDEVARYLVKVGMRERYGQSFQTLLSSEITARSLPADVLV
ncbi:phosphate ABC transporter, permease protein PstA, partial [Candidatus Symbiopectobacterium sp. NZEC135]|nr:phosphate ABC transporter, permease protein PstA [Candidatus Symbiopectobacterium sp. NZEC135]